MFALAVFLGSSLFDAGAASAKQRGDGSEDKGTRSADGANEEPASVRDSDPAPNLSRNSEPDPIRTPDSERTAERGSASPDALKDAEPVREAAKPAAETVAPVIDSTREMAEPTIGAVGSAMEPARDAAAPVVETAVREAEPVLSPVTEAVEPVVGSAREATAPVVDAAEPVLSPVTKTVEPVVAPVTESVEPVVAPVLRSVEPVIDAIEPVASSVAETAAPVSEIVGPMDGTGLVPTALAPAAGSYSSAAPEPVAAPATTLGSDLTSPAAAVTSLPLEPLVVAPVLLEAGRPAIVEQPRYAEEAATLESGRQLAPVLSAAQAAEGTELPAHHDSKSALASPLGRALTIHGHRFLEAFGSSLAAVGSVPNQVPQPLSSGPASAGIGSTGASTGSGFGGAGLAMLAVFIALLAIGSRLLRFPCEFLRPNSALRLVTERPG